MSESFFSSLNEARLRTIEEPPLSPEEEEQHLPDPEYCTAIVYRQTLYSPEELCENEVYEGEEFCLWHLPRDDF